MMLISVATGMGLQQKIQEKVAAFNGHILISKYDNNTTETSDKPIALNQNFYSSNTINGVSHIQAVAHKSGIIRTENDFEGITLKGVGADYHWQYFQDFLTHGQLPNVGDNKENNELLLSDYLANRLHLSVGDTISAHFPKQSLNSIPNTRKFKIVGLYNSGFQDFDKTIVLADIRHIQRMNKWHKNEQGVYDEVGNFEVFIDDFRDIDSIGATFYEETDSFLDVTTIKEKYYTIFEWIKIFDFNTLTIIGIMILISVINMSVMLLVLILEKTNFIGVLKALGSNNWSIRKIFIYNASYIIMIGLFWGNTIGLGLLYIQKQFKFFPLDPANYYVTEVPIYINFGHVIALNTGTFIICFLLLLIPSKIITKIAPVTAIRFE